MKTQIGSLVTYEGVFRDVGSLEHVAPEDSQVKLEGIRLHLFNSINSYLFLPFCQSSFSFDMPSGSPHPTDTKLLHADVLRLLPLQWTARWTLAEMTISWNAELSSNPQAVWGGNVTDPPMSQQDLLASQDIDSGLRSVYQIWCVR
jgi:hypothetical protein